MSDSKKMSFVDRVLDALKEKDDTKIKRFLKKEVKHLDDQIKIRNEEISECSEKMEDLQEEYNEVLLQIDLNAIKSTEGSKEYCKEYTNKMIGYQTRFVNLKDQMETKEIEITAFTDLKKSIS